MLTEEQKRMLAQDLPRDVVKTRSQAGQTLSYVDGAYVIRRLNEVFGHDGWTFDTGALTIIPGDRPVVHIPGTLRAAGVSRSDVGVGLAAKNSGDAMETAIKAACTDALKRCARTFGANLGLALYDKEQLDVGYSFACQELVSRYDAAQTDVVLAAARVAAKAAWPSLPDDERAVVTQAAERAKARVQPPPTGTDGPQQLPARRPARAPVSSQPVPQVEVRNVRPVAEAAPATPAATAAAPVLIGVSEGATLAIARIEMARSLSTVIASIRGASLRDDERAAVWEAAQAAAERLGAMDGELRRRFDESARVNATRDQWAVAASVLVDVDEATDSDDLADVRKRHAATVAKLPQHLVAGIKAATNDRAEQIGAPTVFSRLLARAKAAASQAELDAVYRDAQQAARDGGVKQVQLETVLTALNGRANELQVAA